MNLPKEFLRCGSRWSWLLIGLFTFISAAQAENRVAPSLRVSDNKRYLVTSDDQPFFYLGDTAWELFHRLSRTEADQYLEDRASKGFTVIQAVALAELDGLNDPNPNGYRPLLNHDPTKPDVKDGADNDYWDDVDYMVGKANGLGMVIGFLPTWGDKWNKKWGAGPEIFTPENAEQYGEWLGRRYRDAKVIWILGGDRPVENDTHRAIIERMAQGLRKGDGGRHLQTFHPTGGSGSSQYFHDADWLDFNMRQNGHVTEFTGRYSQTKVDYDRTPIKPVIDAEPIYEDHPVSFKANEFGHSISSDVRRPLYWDLFLGAFGHTYGHHSVWQMWSTEKNPVNNPLMPWTTAIQQPGAAQMQYGRRLIESRPFLSRIPADDVLVTDRVPTNVPGAGRYQFVATRDEAGRYAMVYAPVGRSFTVHMNVINGTEVVAWWYDPRTGNASRIGLYSNQGTQEFTPPMPGEMLDWVLVLDDKAANFPPPGTSQIQTTN